MTNTVMILIPVVVFFILMLGVGFYIQKISAHAKSKNFSKEYFIGGRSLGGFVLAMTLVATYSSVSSFVSGPGTAWSRGYGWVYFASTQVVAAFIVLAVLGKKMAVVGRRVDAVTVIDVIRARYHSELLANFCALVIVVFFTTTMLGQFIGGAQIFAAVTGLDYRVGLLLFALVVVIYTTVGGFNAVAVTDTICAVVMVLGMCLMAGVILVNGGGLEAITTRIADISAEARATGVGNDLMSPYSEVGGVATLPFQLLCTQWLLCGFTTLGLPQSNVRCLAFKDTKSVHQAMIYGTIVCGAMMVGMHLLGVFTRGVMLELPEGASTDTVIPRFIVDYMHPFIAGLVIIGPLAATMSTISSLLIAGSSAIVKDMYLHYKETRQESVDQNFVGKISIAITGVMGIAAVLMAVYPPDIIVWINLFSFGGLQTVFFWTMLFGLFWKKANACGAAAGAIGGLAVYCVTMACGIKLGSFHNIILGIGSAFIFFMICNTFGKPIDEKTGRTFFPETYDD